MLPSAVISHMVKRYMPKYGRGRCFHIFTSALPQIILQVQCLDLININLLSNFELLHFFLTDRGRIDGRTGREIEYIWCTSKLLSLRSCNMHVYSDLTACLPLILASVVITSGIAQLVQVV